MGNEKQSGLLQAYLNKISTTWALEPEYQQLWTVSFIPHYQNTTTIAQSIRNVIDDYGLKNVYGNKRGGEYYTQFGGYYDLIGESNDRVNISALNLTTFCLANRISVEGMSTVVDGNTNNPTGISHALGGRYISRFSQPNGVKISFHKTNTDIGHALFNPWISAVAAHGLVFGDNARYDGLLCDIVAVHYTTHSDDVRVVHDTRTTITSTLFAQKIKQEKLARLSETAPTITKIVRFIGCAPICINGEERNYGSESSAEGSMRNVDFSCKHLTVDLS